MAHQLARIEIARYHANTCYGNEYAAPPGLPACFLCRKVKANRTHWVSLGALPGLVGYRLEANRDSSGSSVSSLVCCVVEHALHLVNLSSPACKRVSREQCGELKGQSLSHFERGLGLALSYDFLSHGHPTRVPGGSNFTLFLEFRNPFRQRGSTTIQVSSRPSLRRKNAVNSHGSSVMS